VREFFVEKFVIHYFINFFLTKLCNKKLIPFRRLKIAIRSGNKVIANIHGHTHSSQGMSNIGKVKVINGGPLKYGQFALFTLENKPAYSNNYNPNGWIVSSIEFIQL